MLHTFENHLFFNEAVQNGCPVSRKCHLAVLSKDHFGETRGISVTQTVLHPGMSYKAFAGNHVQIWSYPVMIKEHC